MRKWPRGPGAAPGVFAGELSFAAPALAAYRFPCVDITGERAGPRVCVTAGVHVNEVSSIEAAIRLESCFTPATLRGRVSILPVVNQPALYQYTEYTSPVDGKNINFSFPGRPDGSFSEALCHALLYEWAAGADVYVDLHGGDLREDVAKFVMFQRVGDAAVDTRRAALAACFDADFIVALEPSLVGAPGRAITARAAMGGDGVMPEAGAHGVIDADSVDYHVRGVLNLARRLGMVDGAPASPSRRQIRCDRYVWVRCPADGWLSPAVEPGDRVERGQRMGVVRDVFGSPAGEISAPETGYVLWRITHPAVRSGDTVFGVGGETGR
jgi:predicted deacylase